MIMSLGSKHKAAAKGIDLTSLDFYFYRKRYSNFGIRKLEAGEQGATRGDQALKITNYATKISSCGYT